MVHWIDQTEQSYRYNQVHAADKTRIVYGKKHGPAPDGHMLWECKCDCGAVILRSTKKIRRQPRRCMNCPTRRKRTAHHLYFENTSHTL